MLQFPSKGELDMRRHACLSGLLMLTLSSTVAATATAQALDIAARGPRFIASWTTSEVALDVSSSSVLRRRVSLDLSNVTVDEALKEITQRADLAISYTKSMLPPSRSVSLHAHEITVAAALTEILLDAGVDVALSRTGGLALLRRSRPLIQSTVADSGTVTGLVTDRATHAPLVGAIVDADGGRTIATTDGEGRYRLEGLSSGTHTVQARYIGYAHAVATITVRPGEHSVLDFALARSAQYLDELVVSTTLIPTEVKAVSSPVTVVTAEEIENQQLRRTDQVFRTIVPGSFSWEQGTGDYVNSITVRGTSNLIVGQNTVKTYIDGIEASNDLFAVVDVNSIDRLEIIRGPQASTIYGSDAAGGVMQVFTKKGELGVRRVSLDAKASAGMTQSPYGSAAHQEHSLTVRGGAEGFAYGIGGTYAHAGEWAPLYRSSAPSLFAGARVVQGPLTLETSGRYTSRTFRDPWDPRLRAAGYEEFQIPTDFSNDIRNQTLGLSIGFKPTSRWQHQLSLGYDRISQQYNSTLPVDNAFTVYASSDDKASIRYNSSVTVGLGRHVSAAVTGGAEYYKANTNGFSASAVSSPSGTSIIPVNGSLPTLYRGIGTNTGYFGQVQLGIAEALFVTAGLRAEENSAFGTDFGTAVAPRLGLSYILTLPGVTVKARASYGEGIRPPKGVANVDRPGLRANPDLAPEEQVGGEAGLDFYLGGVGFLGATYYNQTARGLIDLVLVDPSSSPPTYQFQNVGQIKNKGLEVEAGLTLPRLAVRGQYSLTSSRVLALGQSYSGELQIGDRLLGVPQQTAGLAATYTLFRGTQLNGAVTHIGSWNNLDFLEFFGFLFGGTPFRGSVRDYWLAYPSVTKVNLGVQHQVSRAVSAFVAVENLGNNERYELNNITMIPGRLTTVGLRLSYE